MTDLALLRGVLQSKDKIAWSWGKENRIHKKTEKTLFLPHNISWFNKKHNFSETSALDIITATLQNKTHITVRCLETSFSLFIYSIPWKKET